MLGNLRVRSKLVAVLLAPVLALAAVAALGVMQRSSVAAESRAVGELTEVATLVTAVADHLQAERTITAELLAASGRELGTALREQRLRTDDAVTALTEAAGRVGGTAYGEALAVALRQVQVLPAHRQAVDDLRITAEDSLAFYATTAGKLIEANARIATETEDAQLASEALAFVSTSRIKELAAQEQGLLTVAFTEGRLSSVQRERLLQVQAATETQRALFEATANLAQRTRFAQTVSGRDVVAANALRINAMSHDPSEPLDPKGGEWVAAMSAKGDLLQQAEGAIAGDLLARADHLLSSAESAQLAYLVLAGGSILIALLLAFLVGRAVTRPLQRLKDAAYEVANAQLPRLVDGLKTPAADVEGVKLRPIPVESTDEIGQLAEAFNAIQRVAVDVAGEQAALLRKGIGDMFVNLARRNQSLLDRQIAFLDELEADERDPDALADLFKLDHLATRMRRNAESLLVLAGAEPSRRWGQPVPLSDVVRAAVSEVEQYTRVHISALDEVHIAGNAAVDVAHMFSELLENATSYSPPETTVEVVGRRNERGYVISITDLGIGMTDSAMFAANDLLANPPVVGLALSRSLGFTVVARLAARHQIQVKLTQTAFGGTTAVVTVPTAVLAQPVAVERPAPPQLALVTDAAPVPPPVPTPTPIWTPTPSPDVPATLAEAVPSVEHVEEELEAAVAAEPQVTSAGLVKRVRGANLPRPDEGAGPAVRASTRSPEQIQSMLSRYRSGLQRGRDNNGGDD